MHGEQQPGIAPAGAEAVQQPPPAAASPGDLEVLGRPEWILSPAALAAAEQAAPLTNRRWRHPGLEDLLARPAGRQPDYLAALDSPEPVIRANAAIALARRGDPSGAGCLAAAARDPALPVPMRCAAVEALGELPGPAVLGLLRELSDQYGQPERASGGGGFYVAPLHAELIRALARRGAAEDEARLLQALRSPSADVRLEALYAWRMRGAQASALPAEVIDQRSHGDWRVRAAVLYLLGQHRPPRTHEYLEAALADYDWRVRAAAIAGLGLVGDEQTHRLLVELLADRSERIRAAAVDALAAAGQREKVLETAGDASWRVRCQVARALARWPEESSARVAQQLLADPSAEVQLAVVEALSAWPLERAGDLLLSAMDRPSLLTRQAAARSLAAQWPAAADFMPEAPAERRREMLGELRRRLSAQLPGAGGTPPMGQAGAGASQTGAGSPEPPATDAAVAAVWHLLAAEDYDALGRFGPALVPALERIVFEFHQPLPEPVYAEVLAPSEPVFAALEQLATGGLMERRRAAAQLAERAGKGPLPSLALERLVQLAAAERDVLVWQDALVVAASAGSQWAERLAYAGLSHPEPEVRRQACVLLADHPDPRHLRLLAPALEDRHPAVRLAAIRAWGLSGRQAAIAPPAALRCLVASGSSAERFEAAVALARVGDPSGKAALERLSFDFDPDVRRRVAEVMGELGDAAFVPMLVRLLDDRASVARAALQSLPKVVGRDVAEQQAPPPADTTERIQRWRRWFERLPAQQAAWARGAPGQMPPP